MSFFLRGSLIRAEILAESCQMSIQCLTNCCLTRRIIANYYINYANSLFLCWSLREYLLPILGHMKLSGFSLAWVIKGLMIMACTCLSALVRACACACVCPLVSSCASAWSHPLQLCIYPALFSSVSGSLRNAGGVALPGRQGPCIPDE